MQPTTKPVNPNFSSGPCSKRPDWSLDHLKGAVLGRSHRSSEGKEKLAEVIQRSKDILNIPDDYKVGIVPASDTGAMEMALWSVLGAREVDVYAFEVFSKTWLTDIVSQLKIDANQYTADFGQLPDLSKYNPNHDSVFVYNGTTSGVRMKDLSWIDDQRQGLTICDATSAVFSQHVDFEKLDITTWSWQKALGGEAAHGMIALSPRAVARLESFTPDRPLPKVFRMTKGGKLIDGIFEGATINTPSMLCVEDCLDSLKWIESIGGLPETTARSQQNLQTIFNWVQRTAWIDFLAENKDHYSNTSICLKIVDPDFCQKPEKEQRNTIKKLCKELADRQVAYDINAYKTAPVGLRIWGGATVETADIEKLLPWLDWAYQNLIES